ncbi:MAG: hypothetical protein F4W92_08615 [Gammaproteobacteria bacterium]|nr:hypothetical protein [Gammaproteobacteria bacterium]
MAKSVGVLLLMILLATTISTFALSTSFDRWENLKEYGNCEVWEQRSEAALWNVSLMCELAPNEKENQAWFRITVYKDITVLRYLPPILRPEKPTNTPDSTGLDDELDGKQLSETPDESIKIRYRFDEEKFKVDKFELFTDLESSGKTVAKKEIDRDELSDWFTELETAESFEYDLVGEEFPSVKITLEESEEAVKDFRERINLLDQQRDTDQEAEE